MNTMDIIIIISDRGERLDQKGRGGMVRMDSLTRTPKHEYHRSPQHEYRNTTTLIEQI